MDKSEILYKNIVRARRQNTMMFFVFIPCLALFVYFEFYSEYELPAYGFLVLSLLQIVLLYLQSDLEHKFKDTGVAYCPKCKSLVERSQVIDKALPKQCHNCGLPVKNATNK
jgi:hypothetical protein